jgi:hypothetical protein
MVVLYIGPEYGNGWSVGIFSEAIEGYLKGSRKVLFTWPDRKT